MSELTDTTAVITALIANYAQTRDELVEVLTSPADGGDAGNGMITVTLPNGNDVKVKSFAAISEQVKLIGESTADHATIAAAIARLVSAGIEGSKVVFVREDLQ